MDSLLGLRSSRVSTLDALRDTSASAGVQMAGIVGFALLTALGAQFRLYLWEVPFTLQTLAVYGSGLYLGWRNGLLAQALYLVLGLFLPVYAGEGFGPAYLFGAVSAGYLLAYPLSSALVGFLSGRLTGLTGTIVSMVAGSIVLFTLGVLWLHYVAEHTTWFESIDKGWLRFAPVDMAKILGVALLYQGSRALTRKD
ncbi:MAG: biotin transporter BioY [Bacteroidetes bacterium]|nr:biotin transporter BioY [Bacteroidota bacterium]MDA0875339.1 biotin transporter BioY [Bacteroidota bacterium]